MRRRYYLLFTSLLITIPTRAAAQWPQFGGPNRDFSCPEVDLKLAWPAEGPPRIWQRALGEGYSGVTVDEGRLFTLYRDGNDEAVIALSANSGQTLWEYRCAEAIDTQQYAARYGHGPRSTPLVDRDRLFTIGFNGTLNCLETQTGRLLWKKSLPEYFDAQLPRWGYANSPLAYHDTLIVPVGGKRAAIVAFDQETGRVRWKRHSFENSYGSPLLIRVDGQEQIVCLMAREVIGVDPVTGSLLWTHPHDGQWHNNIPNPVWGSDGNLFVTSEGTAGSRLLALHNSGGRTSVKERWSTSKFRIVHRNAIRIGDVIYGSSGDFGPTWFSALEVKTGQVLWKRRDIERAGMLRVGDRLIMLEESGRLTLATPTRESLTIHAQSMMLDEKAWTIPTLVDKRLYLRDRKRLMAVELP